MAMKYDTDDVLVTKVKTGPWPVGSFVQVRTADRVNRLYYVEFLTAHKRHRTDDWGHFSEDDLARPKADS